MYAVWVCDGNPPAAVIVRHDAPEPSGAIESSWTLGGEDDLTDVDPQLAKRGWRRIGEWESVKVGFSATIENAAA